MTRVGMRSTYDRIRPLAVELLLERRVRQVVDESRHDTAADEDPASRSERQGDIAGDRSKEGAEGVDCGPTGGVSCRRRPPCRHIARCPARRLAALELGDRLVQIDQPRARQHALGSTRARSACRRMATMRS